MWEINRQARQAIVKGLNIALARGFKVVYGNTDALYTEKQGATEADYEGLAAANRVFEELRRGRVDARELVISKISRGD